MWCPVRAGPGGRERGCQPPGLPSRHGLGSFQAFPGMGPPPRPRGLVVISAGSGHLSAVFCWQRTFEASPHCLLSCSSALLRLRGCSRGRLCWNAARGRAGCRGASPDRSHLAGGQALIPGGSLLQAPPLPLKHTVHTSPVFTHIPLMVAFVSQRRVPSGAGCRHCAELAGDPRPPAPGDRPVQPSWRLWP